ncbi:MAG TPA: HU family DNA-binding protein, partial [Mycobacteriales bacterium]|nr:HU family DNA-binding protein [Mycobacteriales bacterium]
ALASSVRSRAVLDATAEGAVNRAELIDQIRDRLGADKKTAESAVDAVLDTIQRAVARGERVAITGFGVFEKVDRAARTGRNPRTGETVRVKKTSVPKFRPGTQFKGVVSGTIKLGKVADAATKAAAKSTATTARSAAKTAASAPAKAATAARKAAKAAPAKRTTAKKTTAKKSAAKKTTAKKTATKRAPAKKAAVKKTTAKRTVAAKRAPAKKSTAKKATAKRTPAKKSTAKKSTAKRTAKKTAARR